jgi:hypothetical protein
MWGMGTFVRNPRVMTAAAVVVAVSGCAPSSITDIGKVNLVPSVARPDWLTYSGGKNEFALRPVTAADLVSADGQCAAAATGSDAADAATGEGQPASGGIALQMTECDVVRRAGPPEQMQIGADERGERSVVITYIRGARPGVYRFVSGRLNAIERAPGAPAERPQKGKAAKMPARG